MPLCRLWGCGQLGDSDCLMALRCPFIQSCLLYFKLTNMKSGRTKINKKGKRVCVCVYVCVCCRCMVGREGAGRSQHWVWVSLTGDTYCKCPSPHYPRSLCWIDWLYHCNEILCFIIIWGTWTKLNWIRQFSNISTHKLFHISSSEQSVHQGLTGTLTKDSNCILRVSSIVLRRHSLPALLWTD